MIRVNSLTLVATLICLAVVAVEGTSPPLPPSCPAPPEGQIYYPECAPCDGTCENPNPPCPEICEPGCACPLGQVIKDEKCVDKSECECPPVCPIEGQIYYPECAPCDGTCENPNPPCLAICKPGCACPKGQVIKDGKCVDKSECECPPVCPIEGQIYYPDCAPCDGTCENPNPPCPRMCRPGCACPLGQVIKDGKCIDKMECPPPTCPVIGQIYYPDCAPCDGTCDNPNPPCPKICEPGCACPKGHVIFDRKACISIAECPQVCPIEGQIYYPECAPCDGTCENPNPKCPKICRPGCACPEGQVIKDGKCVDKTECECPPECPIKGQIYYPECAPCDGTCMNPVVPCPAICKPGCACPRGEVILDGKQCVHFSQCPRPPVCQIKGQIYYPECAPCDGTCENPNPPCPLICKPGCACPRGKVIKKGKKCVKPKKC